MGVGTNPRVSARVSRGNGVEKYVKLAVIAGTGTMLAGIPRAWEKTDANFPWEKSNYVAVE